MTWADDDGQLTPPTATAGASGPFVPEKLSLGLARIEGDARGLPGRQPSRPVDSSSNGDGHRGAKASGMLMVDGRLYLSARNIDNARLAWSDDRGPLLDLGRLAVRPELRLPDLPQLRPKLHRRPRRLRLRLFPRLRQAYEPADRMVLARVPDGSLSEPDAYEFFERLDPEGRAALDRRHRTSRGGLRASRPLLPLRDHLQRRARPLPLVPDTVPRATPRFPGGFGIYDAPEPWGPWTTVVLHRALGRRAGRDASLPDEVDERRRHDGPPRLLGRRRLLRPSRPAGPRLGRVALTGSGAIAFRPTYL